MSDDRFLALGPDADELWDILQVVLDVRMSHNAAVTGQSPPAADAVVQLGTNAERLVTAAEAGAGFSQQSSPRVLAAAVIQALQATVESTTGAGSPGRIGHWQRRLTFEQGDLRIPFPGRIELAVSLDNGPSTDLELSATLGVHYLPESRLD